MLTRRVQIYDTNLPYKYYKYWLEVIISDGILKGCVSDWFSILWTFTFSKFHVLKKKYAKNFSKILVIIQLYMATGSRDEMLINIGEDWTGIVQLKSADSYRGYIICQTSKVIVSYKLSQWAYQKSMIRVVHWTCLLPSSNI